jgi:hypothetical protein
VLLRGASLVVAHSAINHQRYRFRRRTLDRPWCGIAIDR